MQPLTSTRLAHLPLPLFALLATVVFGAAYLDVLPGGMVGAFALMIISVAVVKACGLMPHAVEQAAFVFFRFIKLFAP